MKVYTVSKMTQLREVTLDEFLQEGVEWKWEALSCVSASIRDPKYTEKQYHLNFLFSKRDTTWSMFCDKSDPGYRNRQLKILAEMEQILGVRELREFEKVGFAGKSKQDIAAMVTKLYDAYSMDATLRTLTVDYHSRESGLIRWCLKSRKYE